MFNFFIALLGGLYYGGKHTHEKSKLNKYNQSANKRQKEYERLRALLCTTPKREREVKDYISCGDNYEKICDDFQNDFEFIFGSDWRKSFRLIPYDYTLSMRYSHLPGFNYTQWVYRLILASKGYIDNLELNTGYDIGSIKKAGSDMDTKFVQCIEQYLKRNGKNVSFVLQSGNNGDHFIIDSLSSYPYKRLW